MLLSAAYGMRRPSFRDLRLVEYTVSVRYRRIPNFDSLVTFDRGHLRFF
jgi:hypothetical protein